MRKTLFIYFCLKSQGFGWKSECLVKWTKIELQTRKMNLDNGNVNYISGRQMIRLQYYVC